jgi:sterol desaturase/sphingolipid hydroxylase (fatty acid hydroxylase superfamily)
MIHAQSVAAFAFLFVSYFAASIALQVRALAGGGGCRHAHARVRRLAQVAYYARTKAGKLKASQWKNQTDRLDSASWVGGRADAPLTRRPRRPRAGIGSADLLWIPACSRKPGRAPQHSWFASINIVVASLFAGGTTEASLRGWSALRLDWAAVDAAAPSPTVAAKLLHVALWFLAAWTWENVLEYAWHRAMHWPWCYRHLHKHHHFYKSPAPLDDMMIHPVEAFGYYALLYSPAFVMPMHSSAFLAYMGVMGVAGVLDHSGVHVEVPWLYNTADHDWHHRAFDVNYGFPHIFMDLLCGTFHGRWAGRDWRPSYKLPVE